MFLYIGSPADSVQSLRQTVICITTENEEENQRDLGAKIQQDEVKQHLLEEEGAENQQVCMLKIGNEYSLDIVNAP